MDLLNLDEILVVKRQIRLKSVDYNVAEQSVGQMITALQLSKKLDKGDDHQAIMEQVVESIQAILPDCPKDVIKALPMRAINAVFEFTTASDKEVIANSEVEKTDSVVEKKS